MMNVIVIGGGMSYLELVTGSFNPFIYFQF